MTFAGWSVFDTTVGNATNTLAYTLSTTTAYPSVPSVQWQPEAVARPDDALTWLRRRVDEVCDLGRLAS